MDACWTAGCDCGSETCYFCGEVCCRGCEQSVEADSDEARDAWLCGEVVFSLPVVPRAPVDQAPAPSFVYEDDDGFEEPDAAFWPTARSLRDLARLAALDTYEDEDIEAALCARYWSSEPAALSARMVTGGAL